MKKYYIWLPVMGSRTSITTVMAANKQAALKAANASGNYIAQCYEELPEFIKAMV